MKKILVVVFLFAIAQNLFAQKANVDSVIHAISISKNDSVKIVLITSLYSSEINNNPEYVIDIGLKLLKQAEADRNILEESSAYTILGQGYRLLGNNVRGLTYHQKAIALAEKINNPSLLAIAENQMANVYKERNEFDKAIQLYKLSVAHATQANNERVESWGFANLGRV